MRVALEVDADDGLVVLADAGVWVPAGTARGDRRKALRALSETGDVFYLDSEDAVRLRLALCVDESPRDLPAHRFHRIGGAFLLSLPTGRLVVGGRTFEVAPGSYSVAVTGTVAAEVDAAAYEAERHAVLSPEDWRYRRRAERLSGVGCVTFLAAAIVSVVYKLSFVSLAALGAAALAALPGLLASRSRRWVETERRLREHEDSYPHYAFELQRVESAKGLAGGHLVP